MTNDVSVLIDELAMSVINGFKRINGQLCELRQRNERINEWLDNSTSHAKIRYTQALERQKAVVPPVMRKGNVIHLYGGASDEKRK